MKVLVTGASGFVGTALLPALIERGHAVQAAVRIAPPRSDAIAVGDIGPDTDWHAALDGCEAVVHLAARVHVMRDAATDPIAAYRRVNTAAAARLAEQARGAGVRTFVFMSTAKVLGESSPAGRPFTDASALAPEDPYAVSKAEAEVAIAAIGAGTGMRIVSVRPPLVYGPGVGANFLRLMDTVARGRPLPLGAVRNRRSLVYVGNLAAAAVACLEHADARGAYLVSDGAALSTPDLIRRIGTALGRPARLLPVPAALLRAAGALAGKTAEIDRLLGDFALAPTGLAALGWQPPFTVNEGLAATAAWYRSARD